MCVERSPFVYVDASKPVLREMRRRIADDTDKLLHGTHKAKPARPRNFTNSRTRG
jgi:hypothetical protein